MGEAVESFMLAFFGTLAVESMDMSSTRLTFGPVGQGWPGVKAVKKPFESNGRCIDAPIEGLGLRGLTLGWLGTDSPLC
jgi:hypothetical protein